MKKTLCTLLVFTLLLTCPAVAFAADETTPAGSDEAALAYLAGELADSAEILLASGEDLSDIYSELTWISEADTYPEKFDLRERGVVTPVKSILPVPARQPSARNAAIFSLAAPESFST